MAKNSSGCRSCLLWASCICVGMALVVGVAVYFGYRKATQFMAQYAQKQPLPLPVVQYSKPELDALQRRIDAFLAGVRSGQTNARLTLSANDVNALVANAGFSNRVYVTLTSNVVSSQFSVPFEELGMPLFAGRYLNGSGTLDVGCRGGTLAVTLKDAFVNGAALPDHYMERLRNQNFARNLATNATTKLALEGVGRIGVVNEQLVLEVRTVSAAESR